MSTQINIKGSTEPTGPAGGDLSGTYPNPTVDGLQGQPVSNATPVNGQVLQYDGTTWVPGSIPSGGSGGGGVVYYLNFNTAADAPLANIPQTPNTSKELGITAETTATSYTSGILSTANYDFLASFVTDLNTPSSISIPAGLWDFNIYAKSTTSNAANQTSFKIEVFKYDGSNAPVSLAVSNEIFIYDPTEITQYVVSVILPQTTILNTDRIVVYLYGKAHQNNNTLTFHFGDGYPSHVHSTIPSVTGTGVVKVINGVFQSPASTIVNSDVSPTANIEVSKLSMSSNRILGRTAAGSGSVEEISLGVTGNSGSATLSGNTLNIPTYTLAGLGGQPQLNGTGFVKATGTTITYDNSTYLTSAITSLNGLTSSTQTFATPGTTGTAPNWNSATSAHTLNIPSANASGVTAGLISNTEFTTFNNKVSTGAITGSGLTMATSRLLGRTTSLSGAVEEITLGTGLSFSGTTLNATISSGAWGIANTSGVYTYYNNLTSAMSAATSGQTIEMFADITETGNVTISLKHGVNINGNGHTYTYSNNSGTMFSCATSGNPLGTIIIENLNIVRTNTASTGASIFTFTGSGGFATTKLYFTGSYITYTVTSGNSPVITATDSLNTLIVDGLFCITNGAGTAVTGGTTTNSYIECTGTSVAFSSGTIKNSRIITTSGAGVASGTAIFCTINCTTSGIGVNEGYAYNCYISTNTGNCMQAGNSIAQGAADSCTISTTSGICFRRVIPSNCVASSGSNLVVDHWFNYGGARFLRNYFITTSTSPVFACGGGTMELVDSTIIQNGTGPGVRVTGAANQDVINCTVIVASAAANCLNATAASNSRYINNKFKGATTPVNANVTQIVTNTIDNQGNILL